MFYFFVFFKFLERENFLSSNETVARVPSTNCFFHPFLKLKKNNNKNNKTQQQQQRENNGNVIKKITVLLYDVSVNCSSNKVSSLETEVTVMFHDCYAFFILTLLDRFRTVRVCVCERGGFCA